MFNKVLHIFTCVSRYVCRLSNSMVTSCMIAEFVRANRKHEFGNVIGYS
jgi:hypothetical protein